MSTQSLGKPALAESIRSDRQSALTMDGIRNKGGSDQKNSQGGKNVKSQNLCEEAL